ncbi:GntR family transcriptional regulator [Demequina sp. NBRC 110057]|uniref:GntR family transcriptional regulator n=1 Tax=Demequina sp. NBRC 110057 TaxID=1570346 RepID=UPI0013563FF5|nr:GntR family transcriptional regulator [Demequina sp. NBRC 110057]
MSPTSALPWEYSDLRSVSWRLAANAARGIVDGSIPAGTVLTESALADEGGASRTPAREAMVQLQTWGLVRLMPKKGAVVTVMSDRERDELLDVRSSLEQRAGEVISADAELAGELADRLDDLHAAQERAIAEEDALAFAGLCVTYHLQIIAIDGNEVVQQVVDLLGPRLARVTYMAVAGDLKAARRFLDEHRDLAAVIRSGDGAAFAGSVHTHIAGSRPTGAVR